MSITATKKKKDGLTCYRVRVPIKMPDGSFKYKERSVYGLQAAKEVERELKEEPKDSGITLNEMVGIYNASRKGQVRQVTAEKSMSYLNLHVLPTMGKYKLEALTLSRMLEWKNSMLEKDLSVVSRNNIYAAFSAVLNFAVKMEYIPKNNLRTLGGFKDANASPEDSRFRYYTPEQFKRYISVAPKKTFEDRRYYAFFMVAFYTGARKGEINALKWTDLDGSTLHIRRSVAQKVKGVPYVETPPKNKSSYRDIQLPVPLLECLAEHRAFCEHFNGFSEDWRICGGPDVIKDNSLFKRNERYAKLAGLPRITIHEFRHSHATLLINADINIKEISRRLGHTNVDITWNVYSHLYPDQEKKVLEVLNKIP